MPTRPPETFRLYPLPKRSPHHYWAVHVAGTLAEMRECILRHTGDVNPEQLALCVAATDRKDAFLLGFLFFAREKFGAGIVTHEMVHAAFRTAERSGRRVAHWRHLSGAESTHPDEECYAHVVERLVRDFWMVAYALGLA